MTRNLFVVVLSGFLAACPSQQAVTDIGSVYNGKVASALKQQRENYDKKRTMVEFDSGAAAQTCGEYLRLVVGSTLKENVNNQLARSEYLLCEVLTMVGSKKLSTGSQDVALGQALAARLDLRSFPSSLFQMLTEQKYSLSHLNAISVKVEPTAVTYETKDWYYRLEVVATLDVNNNGRTDWVLWLTDEAKSGNYRQYQTLIVLDVSDTGLMSAVPYMATMNAQLK